MKFLHEIVANRSYNVDISTSNVIDFMKYPNDLEITGLNTNTSRIVSIGTVCNKRKFYDFGVLCENLQWYDVDTRVTYYHHYTDCESMPQNVVEVDVFKKNLNVIASHLFSTNMSAMCILPLLA